jgi:hypothetical protein
MSKHTFEDWMKAVDNYLSNTCGLSSLDLPDVCYMDMYDDGSSPRSAAAHALREAGW